MVGARPAIGFGHQHAHKSELAELGHGLGRKPLLPIPFRRKGCQPRPGEVTGHIAQHALLVSEPHGVSLIR